ncbi:hypothetical protein GCM10011410_17530 [Hoyosella rhizosphaerae]|uniref:Uncharacterized protein n=1 Tax=Hoyosella rhizosphaerae TaxID=1755582 RepID=A0A916U9S3_9ACTN|nr:hypothetical protein GCM10011410_17530 [Hoyosella rhizosphaerae]
MPFVDDTRYHQRQVMSSSRKPRLAVRQPSNRGGVPRVMTWLFGTDVLSGKRGPAGAGPDNG